MALPMTRERSFFNLDLEGLELLERKLRELPIRMGNRILRKALNDGTDLVYEEAIRHCPRQSAIGLAEDDGVHLVDAIRKRVTVSKKRAWGRVGIDYTKVRYGHLVEFGHRIVMYGRDTGRRSKKKPFMRPAYDLMGERAVDRMANYIYDQLFKTNGSLR